MDFWCSDFFDSSWDFRESDFKKLCFGNFSKQKFIIIIIIQLYKISGILRIFSLGKSRGFGIFVKI